MSYLLGNSPDTLVPGSISAQNQSIRLGREESTPRGVHIAGAVTTQVLKVGPGRFHQLNLNTFVSGTSITVYDSASSGGVSSSNIIAVITPAVGSQPVTQPISLDYSLDFYNGLVITILRTGKPTERGTPSVFSRGMKVSHINPPVIIY